MVIPFTCSCGKRLLLNDGLVGKQAQCPFCKSIHTVPPKPPRVKKEDPSVHQVAERPEAAQEIETVAPQRCISCGIAVSGPPAPGDVLCDSCNLLPRTDTAVPLVSDDSEDADPETEAKRLEARLRMEQIGQELKEAQDNQQRFIPPTVGFAKTRESAPTMVRTKKPDRGTTIRPNPAGGPETMPIPKSQPESAADDLLIPVQQGSSAGSSPAMPSVPASAPAPEPRPVGRLNLAAGSSAVAALLVCAGLYGFIPATITKIASFSAVALCVLSCYLILQETRRE